MDVLNAAASQSALVATVQSVESAAQDPWSYSLSRFTPAHGVAWNRLAAVNPQQAVSGGTVNFDIPKIGWLSKAALTFQVGYPNDPAGGVNPGLDPNNCLALPSTGYLNLIDYITVNSASRELYRMTRDALLCSYADLTEGEQLAIQRGMQMQCDPAANAAGLASDAASGFKRVTIPLLFPCFAGKSDLNLAALFSEPLRITVTFRSQFNFHAQMIAVGAGPIGGAIWADGTGGAGTDVPLTILNPEIITKTASLSSELTAATLSQNYSAGSLSQLSYNYIQETVRQTGTMPALGAAGATMTHTLTSTNCVHDIYVFCEIDRANTPALNPAVDDREVLSGSMTPIPLLDVTFTCSGQNIVQAIPAEYYGLYGKPTTESGVYQSCGQGGFWRRTQNSVAVFPDPNPSRVAINSCYVYRIQFSESASKLFSGNMVNLRELSNPTITVTLPRTGSAAGAAYVKTVNGEYVPSWMASATVTMKCVLRTASLLSTDSQNGRTVQVLSN